MKELLVLKKNRDEISAKYKIAIPTSNNTKTTFSENEGVEATIDRIRICVNLIFNKMDIADSLYDTARGGLAVAAEEVKEETGITTQALAEMENSPEFLATYNGVVAELQRDSSFMSKDEHEKSELFSKRLQLKFLQVSTAFKIKISTKVNQTALFILALPKKDTSHLSEKGGEGHLFHNIPSDRIKAIIVPESMKASYEAEKKYFSGFKNIFFVADEKVKMFRYGFGFPASTTIFVEDLVVPGYKKFLIENYEQVASGENPLISPGEILATHMTRL